MGGPMTGTGRPRGRRPPSDELQSPEPRPDRQSISATDDFLDCTGDFSSDGNKVRPWSIQPSSSLGRSSPRGSPEPRPDRQSISATDDFLDCTGDFSSDGNKVRPWSIQPSSSLGRSSPRGSKGIDQRIPSGSAANNAAQTDRM